MLSTTVYFSIELTLKKILQGIIQGSFLYDILEVLHQRQVFLETGHTVQARAASGYYTHRGILYRNQGRGK